MVSQTGMTFNELQSDVRNYLERGASAAVDPIVYEQIPRLITLAERNISRQLKVQALRYILSLIGGVIRCRSISGLGLETTAAAPSSLALTSICAHTGLMKPKQGRQRSMPITITRTGFSRLLLTRHIRSRSCITNCPHYSVIQTKPTGSQNTRHRFFSMGLCWRPRPSSRTTSGLAFGKLSMTGR